MQKKYKHIKLPKKMIGQESGHTPHVGRLIPELQEFDLNEHRTSLRQNVNQVVDTLERKKRRRVIERDRNASEVEITFRGRLNAKLLEKYRVQVYQQARDDNNDAVVQGKISNEKIRENVPSDFERLTNDISQYVQTGQLKSYFDDLKKIEPLDFEQVVEHTLESKLKSSPEEDLFVDISFASDNLIEDRYQEIKREYGNKMLSAVSMEGVHFCRVSANYEELKNTTDSLGGITEIEESPLYTLLPSVLSEEMGTMEILPSIQGLKPVFVFDGTVNDNHPLIQGAVIANHKGSSNEIRHGTAVSSLVICGQGIKPNGTVQQENHIIALDVLAEPYRFEERLVEYVQKFSQEHEKLIINLSVNDYKLPDRTTPHKLTVLIDELSIKYNCLFIISAGNLFRGLNPEQLQECRLHGYPHYFNLDCTNILAPADAVNALSVGSVTYQQSPESITGIESPSPITRGNFTSNKCVKPDLVHYDSNYTRRHRSEDNGVYMAGESNTQISRGAGTSFATPLVTNLAGKLLNLYPEYNLNSIKALLIHFTKELPVDDMLDTKIRKSLVGFGIPKEDKVLSSFATSSCIVIEDSISINKKKKVRFPVPACIAGHSRKRLRVRKTLVYNPKVNPQDLSSYIPLTIIAQLHREDDAKLGSSSSKKSENGAHRKANVKKYQPVEVSTTKHTGDFWYMDVVCESKDKHLPDDYSQDYSIVLSLEDMKEDETINLHEEVQNMIQVESQVEVDIELDT